MIIISPYSKFMRNGAKHPKNYPYWDQVISHIKEPVIQVGVEGETQLVSDFRKNLPLSELATLVHQSKTWMSCDSFFQHFCWDLGKPGVVVFSQSDPNIFGHPENINLLKDRKYLREKQFWIWEQAEYNEDAFVGPDVVLQALKKLNVEVDA
jgi:ADP-heptose:LPS heptosyltransferase